MSNWLEKAEENQKIKEKIISSFDDTTVNIIEDNHKSISPLLNKLIYLIERVAKISIEFRRPSLEIGYTKLKGDPIYEFFGSAYLNIDKNILFFKISSEPHLCWRRIYFKIAEEPNRLKLTLTEKCTSEINKRKTISLREKYKYKISDLNEDLAKNIIDWLAFKNSTAVLKKVFPTSHFSK